MDVLLEEQQLPVQPLVNTQITINSQDGDPVILLMLSSYFRDGLKCSLQQSSITQEHVELVIIFI